MRISISALLVVLGTAAAVPAMAQQQQQPSPNTTQMQDDANKGVKTRNSGESGYVADQEKPGASANAPGRPSGSQTTGSSSGTESSSGSGSGGRSR